MKRLALLKFAALALAAGSALLPAAHAATGKLVYYMNYGDDPNGGTHYQIYTIDADGTHNVRIVHPGSSDQYPSLSPDGKTIAYTSVGDGISLMNVDGTNVRLVPNSVGYYGAVWSPDGKRLAAYAPSSDAIMTLNADGSGQHSVLSSVYSIPSLGITWSPDGTKIAYAARDFNGTRQYYVLVANADGSGEPAKLSVDNNAEYDAPAWSPDGMKIAVKKYMTSNYGIYLLDAATGAETSLKAGGLPGDHPAWSPDGKQIAFESYADGSYGDIGIVNADGSNFHSLSTIGQANYVGWSAGGSDGTVAGAPVITSTQIGPIVLGQRFNTFLTTDGTAPIDKYAVDILPAGLSLNTGTGEIFGTVQAGDVPEYTSITVTVTSTAGVSTSKDLPLVFSKAVAAAFTVSLVKPASNVNAIAGATLNAKAKVNLSNAGSETVASIAFQIDGKTVGTALTGKPYKEVLVLDELLAGTHQLTALATGNDGRVAYSAPVAVTVSPRFVDLTGSASFSPKLNAKGKLVVKGDYTLSNRGNAPSGPFAIALYLSDDAEFDAADRPIGPLVQQLTGKNSLPDIAIPGLAANTTLSSADPNALLPPFKVTVPAAAIAALNLSGKYLLVVLDPANAVGEEDDTRANNVIVVKIP